MNEEEDDRDDDKNEESLAQSTDPGILSRMALNDNKAGMQGLDKEKINRIIHENSVGSRFYKNEKKKDAQVDARISKLLEQVQKITAEQMDTAIGQTNAILKSLEKSRDLTRTIVHIDMDAFYASVEERDNPDLKNKPMAVGGMDMLSTSNYVARRYGVRAAMPGFIGKKLCPELILVPLNLKKYTEVSDQVRKILASYDPNFAPMGLDEAYLDLTYYLESRKSFPEVDRTFVKACDDGAECEEKIVFGLSVEEVVKEMRFRIEQETRLTASAGIAPNTLLAKVASDMNKPNGQFILEPTKEKVLEFINKLPIRKVSGIGKVTEKLLNAIGIKSCHDLYEQRGILYTVFSQTMSSYLLRICIGIGATVLENDSERKSISTERTFSDISKPNEMYKKCEELCDALEIDTKRADVKGSTVTLKIKTASFELHTRSKTLFHPVNCKSEVYPIVADLLKQELATKNGHLTLRLIGVGLSKLTKSGGEGQQKSLDYFLQKASTTKKRTFNSLENEKDCTENGIVDSENDKLRDDKIPQQNRTTDHRDCDIVKEEHACAATSYNKSDSTLGLPGTSHFLNADDTQDVEKYTCPICSLAFQNLPTLTVHVDNCASPKTQDVTETKQSVFLGLMFAESSNNNSALSDDITCFTCPICNATFCSQDVTLEKFNTHVDSCLNRKTIRELVKSESKLYRSESSSIKSTSKRNGRGAGPPSKRKKKSETPSCTLDKFFK